MQPCGWSGGHQLHGLVGHPLQGEPHRGGDQVAFAEGRGTPCPSPPPPAHTWWSAGAGRYSSEDVLFRTCRAEGRTVSPSPLRSHKYDLSCTHSVGIQIEACLLWLVFVGPKPTLPAMSGSRCPHYCIPVWSCRGETELSDQRSVRDSEASAWHWDGAKLASRAALWCGKQRLGQGGWTWEQEVPLPLSGPQKEWQCCSPGLWPVQPPGSRTLRWEGGRRTGGTRGRKWKGAGEEKGGSEGMGASRRVAIVMGAGSALRRLPWGRR